MIEELRDQNASLSPVEDRGAQKGDYAVIKYEGTREGVPFEGGTAERMPLIIGEDRLIPGFEDELVGLRVGDTKGFDITFPADYGEETLAGQTAHFEVELRELREKILPDADDDFARSMGDFEDLANMRDEIRKRLERNALDKARHTFSDRIIEYAVANSTIDLPDILVEQEVEVMHDEFRGTLARQGIGEEAYTKVSGKSHEDLHNDFRPGRRETGPGSARPERDRRDRRRGHARRGRRGGDRLAAANATPATRSSFALLRLESAAGTTSDRPSAGVASSSSLVDDWLAAHPDHPAIPHVEDGPADSTR